MEMQERAMEMQERAAVRLERLLDQLTHAVERASGRTTITPTDLAVLRNALQFIK